jgi:hypothetical protein
MHVFISPLGTVHSVYDEALDLRRLGPVSIRRASTVEPDASGQWWADLGPVNGPRLGPFPLRSDALAAERTWLDAHWRPES